MANRVATHSPFLRVVHSDWLCKSRFKHGLYLSGAQVFLMLHLQGDVDVSIQPELMSRIKTTQSESQHGQHEGLCSAYGLEKKGYVQVLPLPVKDALD